MIKALFKKRIVAFFRWLMKLDSQERYRTYREKYTIHPTFRFNGDNIKFYGDGGIICGSDSYIGDYSTCQSVSGCKIQIGDYCAISHNVRIYTSTYIADQDFMRFSRKMKEGDVYIGDAVWIGVNVFIGPGVRIGNNTIIGANNVIIKNIPSNSIVGSNQVRVCSKS